MSIDERSTSDNFDMAMQDVQPLKRDKRVLLQAAAADNHTMMNRRHAAEQVGGIDDPLNNAIDVKKLDPLAILAFQRPGVQNGVYKQLRLGKYTVEARLDLHGMSVEQARVAVYQFVCDCMSNDVRCALINHGKGEGRLNPAVLKSHLAHWLPQIEAVLAFHSAQKHHGGSGATYLLLKKSMKKRQENLEQHQRRR